MGEWGKDWLRGGGGGHGARDGGWGELPRFAVMLATGQFKVCVGVVNMPLVFILCHLQALGGC
jgi:hypothetical protein